LGTGEVFLRIVEGRERRGEDADAEVVVGVFYCAGDTAGEDGGTPFIPVIGGDVAD
jgi:hypothetical protein